jgi:pyridoxine 5-phosphate synthase
MVELALRHQPDTVTLVPEKRQERTTEGGLDVVAHAAQLRDIVASLRAGGIVVSLFIDADPAQVRASAALGVQTIELHTGDYCEATSQLLREEQLSHLRRGAQLGHELGLSVAAGHGLDYVNVAAVARLPHVEELNIGHAIVARALFTGMERAVREMIEAMHRAPAVAETPPPRAAGGGA